MNNKIYLFLILIVLGSLGTVIVSSASNVTTIEISDNVAPSRDDDELLLLTFERYINCLATYELLFDGDDVKITYIYNNSEPIIETGKYINGKIIVDGCDYCYKLVNTGCDGCQLQWELCVYNPERDDEDADCYTYNDIKSNGIVMDLY